MGAKVKHLTTPDNSGAGNRENDSGNEGGSERAGSLVQDVGSHILVLVRHQPRANVDHMLGNS